MLDIDANGADRPRAIGQPPMPFRNSNRGAARPADLVGSATEAKSSQADLTDAEIAVVQRILLSLWLIWGSGCSMTASSSARSAIKFKSKFNSL